MINGGWQCPQHPYVVINTRERSFCQGVAIFPADDHAHERPVCSTCGEPMQRRVDERAAA